VAWVRKMLLSFKQKVYKNIKSGEKIFAHKRNFLDEQIMAYMYVIGKKNLRMMRIL
jgi:hypothetical protein